ncbi:MAG: CHASE2 domain-containing protein, partial [Sphingorhabdus sp.]|nr:CHASE2 domain-containing protein [Sphingorhabdus sp.]
MNLRRRLLIEWALIALFGTLAVILATHWRGTSAFDNLVYDQLSSLSRPQPDDQILLINIDEASLARIGKWPWNRNIHAQLIDKLAAAGPRTILLDVLMSEPANATDDNALADAMRKSGAVFLPLNFHSPGSDGKAYDTEYPLPTLGAAAKGVG